MKAAVLHGALRGLPVAPLSAIVPGTALILAPHADDESLGCGGLIAACCAAGRPPLVVILSDGVGSHPHSPSWPAPRLRAQRQHEALRAVSCLGLAAERLLFLDLPDTAVPHAGPVFERSVRQLAHLCSDHGCGIVLAPWRGDPHCDHEAAWKMAVALQARCGVGLLAYPVWGWLLAAEAEVEHEWPVGMRLDIAPYHRAKARAVSMHESQYGNLITDDPTGFSLPVALLAALVTDFEVFIRP
ncbi:PIG-L family deacetylase [Komagataeibacter sp. FNDCR1]|nr:PIG-L family deacetylase [Komagataeibacter sp. FNDCR1]